MYAKYMKRLLDFVLSLMALIILLPLLAIVAILVRVKLGAPVIFQQKRPGENEKIFTMYKFRTMTDERDINGNFLSDEIRLTKFGKLLRSTSLDELPELVNILKGDMSIVGPRPQLVRDMVFMTNEQRRRHTVRPGLTGLAQVNGRNAIAWEDKLNFDIRYIEQITFRSDCLIVIQTIKNVLGKKDINAIGAATAEDLGDYLMNKGIVNEGEYNGRQAEAKELTGV